MGKRRLVIRLHLHTRFQEEMHFPCSGSQLDVSQLCPGVIRACQHSTVMMAKCFNSSEDLLVLGQLGLYYAMTRARPLRESKRTEMGAMHIKVDDNKQVTPVLV